MTIQKIWLASSALSFRPVYAFAGSFTPALPGSYNPPILAPMIAAAEMAASQQEGYSTDVDLSARDSDSARMYPYWELTDDLIAGYKTIKAGGTKYLPKFSGEDQDDYNARLEQTDMTNVYADIIETLSGKPFEEEIQLVAEKTKGPDGKTVEQPLIDEIEMFIEDVDGAGNNLTAFAAHTFFNGINSAIDWIYVDYPVVKPGQFTNRAAEKSAGVRPFWSHVLGRNMLEAKSMVINGKETLVYMRILEPGKPNHVRVFEYSIDATGGGSVNWGLFEEKIESDGTKKTFHLIDFGNVTIGVIPLVPFITGRRDGRTWFFYAPMQAAADTQVQLYQQESGLKFAKIMTAYPMLAANGITPEKEADGKTPKKLKVGPNRVLYSIPGGNGEVGSWGYVSPDAACLKFLKDDIKETMDQLRELGRQPLTAQSGNLTVITTAFAAGKTNTAVAAWGLRLADALENALKMTCAWLNINFEPEVKIFDEYDDYATDQAADLTALATMREKRDLSYNNYMREMKRRNVLRPDFDAEENQAELLEETPSDDTTQPDDGTGNAP